MIDVRRRAEEHATCSSFAPYKATEEALDLDRLRSELARLRRSEESRTDFSDYERLIEHLRRHPRCEVRTLRDLYQPLAAGRFAVALRHDIDRDPFAAVKLAQALHESGLPGSFYILHTVAYYGRFVDAQFVRHRNVVEMLRAIQDRHGCELGLHTDSLLLYQHYLVDGAEAIRQEVSWLRSLAIRVEGSAAHNSAPVYGAENFEVFEGRAVLGRFVLARNELRTPLQTLNEAELGLTYEANYPDVDVGRPGPGLSQYLSGAPADAVRNPAWMSAYLLHNPYCRWGHDYNAWLIGRDRWVVSGHVLRDPLFSWDVRLEGLLRFLDQVPGGRHLVFHIHPDYVEWPHAPSDKTGRQARRRSPAAEMAALGDLGAQLSSLQSNLTGLQLQASQLHLQTTGLQLQTSQVPIGLAALGQEIDEVVKVVRYIGPERLRALRDFGTLLYIALMPLRGLARILRLRVLVRRMRRTAARGREWWASARKRSSRSWQMARFCLGLAKKVAILGTLLARSLVRPRPRRAASGRRVLMLTISQVDIDPRISKMARTLAAIGFDVDVLCTSGLWIDGVREEAVHPGVRHVRVPWDGAWQPFWLFYQHVFWRAALARAYDYVHANDLTTLMTGWLLARTGGVPLVYDAHEMWSENVSYNGKEWVPMPRLVRWAARAYEGFLVRQVDALFTVSHSIVEEFRKRYRLARPPRLVANFPDLGLLRRDGAASPSIRSLCGLGPERFVTLYLGGVNPLRNIENVIRAHRHLPEDCVFVIRGPGVEQYGPLYRNLARELGIGDRVFCLPPVGMEDVIAGAKGADCGIVMLRNICRNFYWFYPNKLFEYMLSGLPVAASDFPDVRAHLERERCGVVFDPESPESIAAALRTLRDSPEETQAMGRRGREGVLREYNWETAARAVIEEYRRVSG